MIDTELPLLVFDYDGTIHKTHIIYEAAFRKCQRMLWDSGFPVKEVSSEKVKCWLGMNVKEMWLDYAPELPENVREKASLYIGKEIHEMVKNHESMWYDGARRMLAKLKKQGFCMVILSNSRKADGVLHWKEFHMGEYFEKWYDCESFQYEPKSEIIKYIANEYKKNMIVIGDRESDILAAKTIDAKAIGCAYGYGNEEELAKSDYIAKDVTEIDTIVCNILNNK